MGAKIDKHTLDVISKKTGLKLGTCLDLLAEGWTYVEGLDGPARWLSPQAALQRRG